MRHHGLHIVPLLVLLVIARALLGQTQSDQQRGAAAPRRIAVVVSRQNAINSLTLAELRRVFLRQKTQWANGWQITVYERSSENPIRERFSRTFLGKTPFS